jgi:membrane-bound lytic murein transglycosylase D
MTPSRRSCVLLTALIFALAFSLTGCLSNRSQSFKFSFLPATPIAAGQAIEEAPRLVSHSYSDPTPNSIHRALAVAPRAAEVDAFIFKAEAHFDAGKKLYQQGDVAGARREFDIAVDTLLAAPDALADRQRMERKLDQMSETIYRYDLEGLGPGERGQPAVAYDKTPLDDILQMTFPTDPNLRPKVKEELLATVSQLPLEENDTVLSYIHYFSTDRGHRTLVGGLRRAGRYRPLIQRILDEEGVPQELIFLAQAESGFLPRAKSYKAAVGMWQFVKFRGQEYGLMQEAATDDRMDPEKATRAAARHLHDLYNMFGDWYLAMAAYNCGPGCVDRAVQRTGYADFWELTRHDALPQQTANYVPLILAMTIMAKNPKDYDLENLDVEQPLEYDTIAIEAPTHLGLIADAADRPISEIQDLNPSLLKPIAPAGHQLRVPKGTSALVRGAVATVPATHRSCWRIHRVASGETLAEIARRYATSASSISAANSNRLPASPEPGDLLVIPAGYPAPRPVVAHNAKSPVHKKASRRAMAEQSAPAARPSPSTTAVSYKTASVALKHRPTAN